MLTPFTPPKEHGDITCSGFKTHTLCPGSWHATKHIENTTSKAAEEGTAAHWWLLERRLRGHLTHAGAKAPNGVKITKPMIEYLEPVAQYIETLAEGAKIFETEIPVPVGAAFGIEDMMWGTIDCIILDKNNQLHIIDLKYGYTPVDPKNNLQLILYFIGARQAWKGKAPTKANLTICQPRTDDFPKTYTITKDELNDTSFYIQNKLVALLDENAQRIPGEEQCRWCGAAGSCPEQMAWAIGEDFEILDEDPATLSDDKLAQLLAKEDAIKTMLENAKAHALSRLAAGHTIPGFKRVTSITRQSWVTSDIDELHQLLRKMRLPINKIMPRKPVTPTQAKKLVDKHSLNQLIFKPQGSPTLAKETDKRPALEPDFSILD